MKLMRISQGDAPLGRRNNSSTNVELLLFMAIAFFRILFFQNNRIYLKPIQVSYS